MKKKMIDIRNEKIIAFALVAVLLLIGTVGLASATAAEAPLLGRGGLIAYYPFNGNANDASGNGNDGMVYEATYVDNGGCGKALSFDGIDDYVSAAVNINPDVMPQMTMVAWVRPDLGIDSRGREEIGWAAVQVISHDNGGFDRSLGIDSRGGEEIGWAAFSGSGSVFGYPVTSGEWAFIAAVYDQNAETVKLFVNGALINEEKGSLGTGWEYIYIGANPPYGEYFPGIIDEVRIYNYALSQSEIQADMRECTPSTPTATGTPMISPTATLRPTPTPAPIITKLKKCVGNEPYLYVGDKVMGKGKTVEIPIIMCNAKDLANMDLDWSYDASVLKLIDVTKGSLNKKAFFEWNKVSPGKLKIAFASSKGVSGSGSIAVMKFEVIGNTGAKSTITGTVDTASKTDGSTISVGVNPGEVTVGTSPIKGDCDGDNKLTSRDALAALQMSVEKREEDLCYDYNGDGKVNSADARDILKAVVTGGK